MKRSQGGKGVPEPTVSVPAATHVEGLHVRVTDLNRGLAMTAPGPNAYEAVDTNSQEMGSDVSLRRDRQMVTTLTSRRRRASTQVADKWGSWP